MSGYFELKKAKDGQFYFVLKAGNHEVILTSEMYHQEASAKKGIASVQTNSSDDKHFERKDSTNGKPYFNLKAANHEVIGVSQMYESAETRDHGIASVKANGTTTIIKIET